MIELLTFIISFFVITWAGGTLVRSLTLLARLFKMSEYVVAFIFMSFATSVSELFVGISSALEGIPDFSFGNVLGANIINLTLVVGLAAFLNGGIKIESKFSKENFIAVFLMGLLPLLLAWDGVISRPDGFLLIIIFVGYIWRVSRERETFTAALNDARPAPVSFLKNTFKSLGIFLGGLLLLVGASAVLVKSGDALAARLSWSHFAFAALFVSIGTTLPELVFGIKAVLMKHASMAVGNSLGSVAFNSAFIVGVVSIISPIPINFNGSFILNALFLALSLFFFTLFVYSKSMLKREEGVVLFLIYLAFFFSQYYLLLK